MDELMKGVREWRKVYTDESKYCDLHEAMVNHGLRMVDCYIVIPKLTKKHEEHSFSSTHPIRTFDCFEYAKEYREFILNNFNSKGIYKGVELISSTRWEGKPK